MDSWNKLGPAKIPMKWISKDASRNLTFLKRKKGLKKKVEELSILCGVDACMVCFGPQVDQRTSQEQHLDVWPDMPKALEVIERYRRLSKEEQDKKKLDNSTFLQLKINKLKLELNMKRKENEQLEMGMKYPCWDNCLNDLSVEKLRDLIKYIDAKLETVGDRINFLTRTEHEVSHTVGGENNVVPIMEYAVGQPLMEPYHSLASQNIPHMSVPYETQESLTTDPVQPYLNMAGHFPRNPLATKKEDYQFGANPWAFGDNNNSQQISGLLENYPGQWIPCCTVFSPCPDHSTYP